jgi:segregation and condensation protein A
MSATPDISLPRFEGPLDLLLELVRKNEIEITDIPIAEITRQYLDYLHQAEALDLDLGSEFAYMAARLIHIKSRCLLAPDPEAAPREEDPRQELMRLLLSHDEARQGAEFLKQKLEIAQATWSKASIEEFREPLGQQLPEANGALNLLQVLRLAQQALDVARMFEIVTPTDFVTVEEMMCWLEQRLAPAPGRTEAEPLLAEQPTAERRTALFLAMLELAKAARIRMEQHQCFGPIFIYEMVSSTVVAQPCLNVE